MRKIDIIHILYDKAKYILCSFALTIMTIVVLENNWVSNNINQITFKEFFAIFSLFLLLALIRMIFKLVSGKYDIPSFDEEKIL